MPCRSFHQLRHVRGAPPPTGSDGVRLGAARGGRREHVAPGGPQGPGGARDRGEHGPHPAGVPVRAGQVVLAVLGQVAADAQRQVVRAERDVARVRGANDDGRVARAQPEAGVRVREALAVRVQRFREENPETRTLRGLRERLNGLL